MLKIFLSSHGSMASGMQSSLKILMGECENLTVFDAYLDESCVQDHLDAFYETVGPEDEVLLCSDLYGGSVNQAMFTYLDRPNTRLVSGVNMSFMMNVLSEDTSATNGWMRSLKKAASICAVWNRKFLRTRHRQAATTSSDKKKGWKTYDQMGTFG